MRKSTKLRSDLIANNSKRRTWFNNGARLECIESCTTVDILLTIGTHMDSIVGWVGHRHGSNLRDITKPFTKVNAGE